MDMEPGRRTRWAILTGEYPPTPGGVADYTRQVAAGLAAAGDNVTVYAPPATVVAPSDPGVNIRRLPNRFGPRGLLVLERALAALPRPDRILIQYVPHAYGYKAMNVPFVAWSAHRAAQFAPVWVMFHEVMYGIEPGQPLRYALLGRVTRAMARRLAQSAERVFVSIPAWGHVLQPIGCRRVQAEWLPIPSNVPHDPSPESVAAVRGRYLASPNARLIGHFGTFAQGIVQLLEPVIHELLTATASTIVLLLGRGSDRFRESVLRARPEWAARLRGTGGMPATELAAHLAACDVLLQPYPDGVSCRRGSLMAGLALGRPIVTTEGRLSEAIWRTEQAVEMVPTPELAKTVLKLLDDPPRRAAVGERAGHLYQSRFALEHTIRALRGPAAVSAA